MRRRRGQAPGANDDASGTAVSWSARGAQQASFSRHIIFLTVPVKRRPVRQRAFCEDDEAVAGHRSGAEQRYRRRRPHAGRYATGSARVASFFRKEFFDGEREELRQTRSLAEKAMGPRATAPYVGEVAKEYLAAEDFRAMLVFRHDRTYARRSRIVQRAGICGSGFTEFCENYNHQHQNVRTENGVEYGDSAKIRDYDYTAKWRG